MPVPVITVAQMREWENSSWEMGKEMGAVMRQAAAAVAQRLHQLSRRNDPILFLAGPGNNGGDTRLAADMMRGRPVELLNINDSQSALSALRQALGRRPAWVVDGLFGIGLNRPLEGLWLELVEAVNAAGLPVLAVDVPSGLDADHGKPMGGAIRAMETITFGAPKTGMVSDAAAEWVGRLCVAHDIGLVDCSVKGGVEWVLREDFRDFPPPRAATGHKGDFGHLGILAGSGGFHGAAVLAARGALRAMPGLVSVVTLDEAYGPVASQLAAAMVHRWPVDLDCDGWLVGPGLATVEAEEAMQAEVVRLWREFPGPVVVDASALAWLPENEVAIEAPRVITPHPGEAARMLGMNAPEVQADRLAALRTLAQSRGSCQVVLKGRNTLTGGATGKVAINPTGNVGLAQGGSGDVLAGLIAGLMVQPALRKDVDKTLRWAAWRHGVAADRLSARRRAWTAEDLAHTV